MKKLRNRRYVMQNPYAHIEQLEASGDVSAISESRLKLQNQYAYLDGDGRFDAMLLSDKTKAGTANNSFEEIEKVVIRLQRQMWIDRVAIFGDEAVSYSPIDVLDPSKAAEFLGYKMSFVDSLGTYADRIERIEVAGLIDRASQAITISNEFDPQVRRFTAAHEIGHLILHPNMEVVHRDRGVDTALGGRVRSELEADKFSAYFLMPAKLLRQEFRARFLDEKFVLNEATAYALLGKQYQQLSSVLVGRKLALKLAEAVHYNGKNFYSLSECFSVSAVAMAIRLEELGLI